MREKFIHAMNKGERMINDKNTLPVLTKEQVEQINKKQPSKEFTESCKKADKLFGINKTKINLKIKEIEKLINLIGWDNWDLQVQLSCRILELKELINDN